MRIANTGSSIVHWRFVPKLEDRHFCKPWMRVTPPLGMLLPGEETHITFTALVGPATANSINTGREGLDDIVVLRVENGRDFYLSASATYARSCFGMSIDQLVCSYSPVRGACGVVWCRVRVRAGQGQAVAVWHVVL